MNGYAVNQVALGEPLCLCVFVAFSFLPPLRRNYIFFIDNKVIRFRARGDYCGLLRLPQRNKVFLFRGHVP